MLQLKNFMTVSVLLTFFLINGCQNEQTPVDPYQDFNPTGVFKVTIPAGAVIDSAKFFINVTTALNTEVTLHRVTNFWEETTVTWNNFAAGFNAASEGSFVPDLPGWYSTDITGLLNEWVEGIYPNYGMLLKEVSPGPVQVYSSKEGADSPFLQVWWSLNGSNGYDSSGAFADTYIKSDSGDVNFGNGMELRTGWQDTVEAQTLVAFEIELLYTGCTRSKGYWKTHSIYGPAPYDSGWAMLGEDSTFFLSSQTNYEVINTPPSGGNAYYILAHHYIAAWLNILNGADPTEVQTAFDDATDLFETYTPQQVGVMKGNNPVRQEFLELKDILEMYNEGIIGPGKCNENNGEFAVKRK